MINESAVLYFGELPHESTISGGAPYPHDKQNTQYNIKEHPAIFAYRVQLEVGALIIIGLGPVSAALLLLLLVRRRAALFDRFLLLTLGVGILALFFLIVVVFWILMFSQYIYLFIQNYLCPKP